MRVCSISWSPVKDDAVIKFSEDFKASHEVTRLDFLIDAINGLQDEYTKTLDEYKKRAKSAKLATS